MVRQSVSPVDNLQTFQTLKQTLNSGASKLFARLLYDGSISESRQQSRNEGGFGQSSPSPSPHSRADHYLLSGALACIPLSQVPRCVEPYQTVIAAMQERQRLYDDQEFQIQKLTQALAAQETWWKLDGNSKHDPFSQGRFF